MGVSFEGVYVPGADLDSVVAVVHEQLRVAGFEIVEQADEAEAARRVTLALHRNGAGVIEIAGHRRGDGEPLASELSRVYGVALTAGVDDGDVWYYTLHRSGARSGRFLSMAEYYGESDDKESAAGDPDLLAAAWPGADPVRLRGLLGEQSTHAEALLADFLEELSIPGALEPPPGEEVVLIHLKHPSPALDEVGGELSEKEQEEAVRMMFEALGVDESKGAGYMELMRKLESVVDAEGDLRPDELERRLGQNPDLRSIAGQLSEMRTDLLSAFETSITDAGREDPTLQSMLERCDRAARIEAEIFENLELFERQPKDAIRANAEVLCTLLQAELADPVSISMDSARRVDQLLAALRERSAGLARDLHLALPLLAANFVAACLMEEPGVDVVREPTTGRFQLMRSSRRGDPFEWAGRALSRRAPVAMADQMERFLYPDR